MAATVKAGDENEYGIPKADFVENPEDYVKCHGFSNFLEARKAMEELYQKYKFMEKNFLFKKMRLMQQIPDIRKTLDVVQHFETSEGPFETTYEISSQLHGFAEVEKVDKVNLWLGANVMMEYSLDEATEVLTKNEKAATEYLSNLENHLEFLKDQLTTVEVNIARFHNLAVKFNQINQKPEVNAR